MIRPMPVHESSQVRRAQSTRAYEGIEQPANPTAARRRPHASSTCSRCGGDRIHVKKIELTRSAADARADRLLIDRHCWRWEHSSWHELRAREEEHYDSPDLRREKRDRVHPA